MIEFLINNSPIISLLLFFSVFCYIVYYLLKPKTKKESEKNAKIPLKKMSNNINNSNDKNKETPKLLVTLGMT